MTYPNNFDPSQSIKKLSGTTHSYHSLPVTAELFGFNLDDIPFSLRPILEGIARNVGKNGVTAEQVHSLGTWPQHQGKEPIEIPFAAGRVLMHDLSGTPAIVDFAAMRSAIERMGLNPEIIEPLVRADLVIDHTVTMDNTGSPASLYNQWATGSTKKQRTLYLFKMGRSGIPNDSHHSATNGDCASGQLRISVARLSRN